MCKKVTKMAQQYGLHIPHVEKIKLIYNTKLYLHRTQRCTSLKNVFNHRTR
jgi:hypothetical protein